MIKQKKKKLFSRYILFCLILLLFFPAPALSTDLEKLTIQLKWFHQFQFAGYYAAIEKGFYAEEGLEVEIRERDPATSHIADVLNGKAQYGVADAGLLLSHLQGQPVVLLAQIYQHSPLIFITRKDSGIQTPYDLQGKRVMYDIEGQSDAPLQTLLLDTVENLKEVRIQQTSLRNEDLFEDKVDAYSAYITAQPFWHQKRNESVNIIDPRDYGIDFYGDNLFTTDQELNTHPQRVERVIRATLKGWRYALEQPEEIIELILKKYNSKNIAREHLVHEARETAKMIVSDFTELGSYQASRFQKIAETYVRLGASDNVKITPKFFYNQHMHKFNLTAQERSFLSALPTLRVPLIEHQPPLSFVDNNLPAGYLNELFEQIATNLGIKYTRIKNLSYLESIEALKNGDVDLLNDYSSFDRREFVIHTKPVLTVPFVIVGRTDNKKYIKSIEDLKGSRLVLVSGFQQTKKIQQHYPKLKVMLVDSIDKAYYALRSREADYYIDNATHAGFYLRDRMNSELQIAGELLADEVGMLNLRFAVGKDKPLLLSSLQKVLNAMKHRDMQALRDKWLFYFSGRKALELTVREEAWLAEHPVIRVALDPGWAPIEYRDENNQYKGMSLDYLTTLERLLDVRFAVAENLTWQEAIEAVQSKQADMFASVSRTPQRETYATFTKPYVRMPIRIFSRNDVSYIGNVDNLSDKHIVVVEAYAIHEWLKSNHPNFNIETVGSPAEGLERVSRGDADVFVGNVVIANYYLGKLGINNVKVGGETPYFNSQAMAVRDDWSILADILQKALDVISKDERSLIFNRWMSIKFQHAINYRLLWQLSALALLLLLIILYWNRRLAKEVQQRKLAEKEIKGYQSALEQRVDERTRALKESEAKVVQILESTAEGILGINNQGKITLANTAALQLLGYKSEELIGKALQFIVYQYPEEGFPEYEEENPMLHALQDGQPSHVENEVLWRKNGRCFPVEYSCMPIIKGIEAIGTVVSFSDITERKQAADRLKLEQLRTEDIIKGTNAGTWDWNISTQELVINQRWADIAGYTLDELVPVNINTWVDNMHPDDLKTFETALEKHFTGLMDYFDTEFRQKHKAGHWVWINARGKVVEWTKDDKPLRMSGTHLDISGRKKAEEELLYQAHFDSLTRLPNRFLALDRLSQHIFEAERNKQKVAVLFMDLDDFKKINDTMGHDSGDKVLIEVAKRLSRDVRDVDTVGRLGGDEFVILVRMLTHAVDVRPVAEKFLESFRGSFKLGGRELMMTASIGIAIYPDDGRNASELLRNADSAMYYSKKQGRNTYSFFTDAMNKEVSRRLLIEEQMHGALGRGEFRLSYQPKVEITSRLIVGVEALLRWHNHELGEVSPDEFIPIAEQTGLIISIGQFVLTEALGVAVTWQKQFGQSCSMSINLSPRQFREPELVSNIETTILQSGLSMDFLELEITEGVLLNGHSNVENALIRFSNMGISIAMDDFGTGYSSLSYLRRYPFNVLKIDRSFIGDITEDSADLELVNAAIAMAHGLGLKVVAEGVETEEQLALLAAQGCEIAQGCLFSKPVPSEEIEEMFRKSL